MYSFRFVSVVWGSEYVAGFLRVCLASQLTPGNLEYLARHASCSYRIYTPIRDAKVIRQSPAYRRLAELMPVEIVTISGRWHVGKYRVVNQCISHFISSKRHEECALVFAYPDVVWADGAGVRFLEIARSGKRMVAINTPPVVKKTFVRALLERYGDNGLLRPIAPRQLVQLALDHLHPDVTPTASDNPRCTPSGGYWMAGGGLLARDFHLCGLMVIPVDRDVLPAVTVDEEYTLTACPYLTDIYVVTDSDDICLLEFISNPAAPRSTVTTIRQMVQWAAGHVTQRHREFVKFRLRYHCNDVSDGWEEVEHASDAFVNAILGQMDIPGPVSDEAPLSRGRYLSPRFLMRKVRELGMRGCLRRTNAALAGAVFGSHVRIRMARALSPPSEVAPRR